MKMVAISGTNRPHNFTSRALAVVTTQLQARGAEVRTFDGRDLDIGFPGLPTTPDSKHLQDAVAEAGAVVIATPEYHGSFAAMTKLILENLGFPSVLRGKAVLLVGVAQGRIGAIKSLEHLRGVCAHMGAIVVPHSVSIAGAQKAFDDDGAVLDEGTKSALIGAGDALLDFVKDYVCPKHVLEAMVRDPASEPWATTV